MTSKEALVAAFAPFSKFVSTLDLTDADAARVALEKAFPSHAVDAAAGEIRAAAEAGWLTPRQASPVLSFGRVAKPGPDSAGCSIDAVDMRGDGPGHVHPDGEVSLCVPIEGHPSFEGVTAGWAVMAAGSHHVPSVSGGRMLIVYFLPNGSVVWD